MQRHEADGHSDIMPNKKAEQIQMLGFESFEEAAC